MAVTQIRNRPSVRWAFMQGFHVSKNGRPYLDRLRVVQTPWFGILLHRIHEPDTDRDPHDHPWPFASLILSGGYTECVHDKPGDLSSHEHHERLRWSWHRMPLDRAHHITEINGVLWTLVLTGRRRPTWRFWTAGGPVDWKAYLAAGEDTGQADWPA